MTERDAVIIGAGPAGLACAEALARDGHDVLVLEEHASVGRPVHCTGVIGWEAFDELDLPQDALLSVSRAVAFLAPGGPSVFVESERLVAAVVDRARFDDSLAIRARAAGATLVTGARVRRIDVESGGVRVHAGHDARPWRARACVLACGASYRFNRQLGLGVPRVYGQSAQVEIPLGGIPHIEVHLGRGVAPAGFAWLVPFERDGQVVVKLGLLCEDDVRRRFDQFIDGLRARLDVGALDVPAPRLKVLPLGPVRRTYASRVLAVGDAAGLVKPTTGGGIYYALLTGRLAARVLGEGLGTGRLDAGYLRRYETLWREQLGPEIRAGLAFRAVATRLSDEGIRALVELARVDGLVPLLKQFADLNWHRGAALALLRNHAFRKIVLGSILG